MKNKFGKDLEWQWGNFNFRISCKKYSERVARQGYAFLMDYSDPDAWVMDSVAEFLNLKPLNFVDKFFNQEINEEGLYSCIVEMREVIKN